MSSKVYTTRQVAERAGVSRQTLQTWIAENRVKAPRVIAAAGVRIWSETDLAKVLKVKRRNYPPKAKKRS
jgi:excisionase family DNA binding protein